MVTSQRVDNLSNVLKYFRHGDIGVDIVHAAFDKTEFRMKFDDVAKTVKISICHIAHDAAVGNVCPVQYFIPVCMKG